jgi:hypothetical protein
MMENCKVDVLPEIDRFFITGAPGSRWSGVAKYLGQLLDINASDLDDIPILKQHMTEAPSGVWHVPDAHRAAYYGTGWKYSADLSLENLTNPFKDKTKRMMHRSHEWAYKLDEISELYPSASIILVYRSDEDCKKWWYEMGGWKIEYPDYRPYYKNDENMLREIHMQNQKILEFATKHNLKWHSCSDTFVSYILDIPCPFPVDPLIFENTWVAMYKKS